MAVTINGTTGIVTPSPDGDVVVGGELSAGAISSTPVSATNLSYTGTLTGGTGVINIGSGQVYKDASGNVGIGTSSPATKLHVVSGANFFTVAGDTFTSANFGPRPQNDGICSVLFTYSGSSINKIDSSAGGLGFFTGVGPAERMRIDSSGNLLVGTATAIEKLTVNGSCSLRGQTQVPSFNSTLILNHSGGSYYGIMIQNLAAATSNAVTFVNSSGVVTGTIITTTTTTAYNTSSDYRLKENVQPMTGALEKVAALNPVTYTWKADGSAGQGFIAHELQAVVPDAVTGEKDAVDKDGKPQYQGVDTSFLVATLTKAIQEQQEQINTLKTEIAALKGQA